MGKKKSCQDVKVPRPLDAVETRLYGWVEEAVLTQPSVVESDSLPEFRRHYPLMRIQRRRGTMCWRPLGRLIVSPSKRVRRDPTSCGCIRSYLPVWGCGSCFQTFRGT
ncbi:hypothetical protein PIB30_013217 [Stylosanthes scabra]|uniref:Uncharacterized protein n=1 Tax=Stylosanthes scabra TaxID=79078 RepID=A0ABU6Q7C8_9FABA|nr:hypothetical protein [Stylosanthes scabra]